jgi:hypothetical protein
VTAGPVSVSVSGGALRSVSMRALVAAAVDACFTLDGRPRSVSGALSGARKAVRALGIWPSPVGAGNGKTGAPGTYRRVHATCPRTCPQYVAQLAHASREIRAQLAARGIDLGDRVLAWSYTAHAPGPYLDTLRDAGIAIRSSGTVGPWGAAVGTRRSATEHRARGVRSAVCPAQLRDVSCVACKLCWSRPEVGIVFLPHGPSASRTSVTA